MLLLDEFDVLSDTPSNYSAGQHFFPYLQRLINQHSKLFIIPVIGRNLDDLPNLLSLFSGAPNLEIGLLEDISARRLITRPSQDMLEYEHNAIEAILKLSAGHPYFTQIICNALFREAKSRNNSKITRTDVESITDQAIENAEGGLDWFWKGLPTPEQVVFSAVAEAQRIAILENKPVPEEPLKLLKNYGVKTTDYLVHTAHLLADKGFLDKTERMVKIELVRRWLVQRHPLRQEILQLENLQQEEIAELREAASREDQQGNQERAKILYERILDINPNHFSSITHLAQIHLQNENCEESVELYRRAYQADRIRNQEGYLRALQAFGEKLITQKAWTVAKEQFSQVLEIEPDNQAAQGKLEEIERTLLGKVTADSRNLFRQKRILFGGVAAGIIALVSFGTYRLVTPCYAGHQKIFGVYCALDQRKIDKQ
ncbi:hypothetical protein [Aetokthonos hydrillicola]|uniref:hypothetical protein n=1 Tax=Aetokthonos hydrillicola TaxID=1550245 RepID=UPI0030D6CEDB